MSVDEALAALIAIKSEFGPLVGAWPLAVGGPDTFVGNVTGVEVEEYSSGTYVTVRWDE